MVRFVSFNTRRLQNLTANNLKIKPAINQVELSYWNPQPELVKVGNQTSSTPFKLRNLEIVV